MSIYSPSYEVWEEHNTVSETWDVSNRGANVTLRCNWSDRHDVAAEMLGLQVPFPHGNGASAPVCQSIGITPAGNEGEVVGQSITYKHALLNVTYGYNVVDLVSESLEPTAEFLTQDYRGFRWGGPFGDVLQEGEAPGKLVRGLVLNRTIYNVAPPLPTSLLTLPGYCNSAPYFSSLLGLAFDSETLLFGTPTMDRTIRTDGSDGFTLNLAFTHKATGWNRYWRAKTQSYQRIYTAGGSEYYNHPPGNFSAFLF